MNNAIAMQGLHVRSNKARNCALSVVILYTPRVQFPVDMHI